MPGIKRKFSRRRTSRPYKRARRTRAPRGLTLRTGDTHHFKRTFEGTRLYASSAGGNPQALYVTFGDLPNASEFTSLFDMYRINLVVLKLVPNYTGNDINPSTTVVVSPNVHSAIDYDDSSTAGLTVNTLLQYPNHKMTRGHQMHIRKFRPAVCLDADGAGSTAPKWKQWINLSATTAEHRGVKLYIEQAGGISVNSMSFSVFWTVYFSCKGVR